MLTTFTSPEVLTGAGLEGFWPQPPHFGWTAQQTAHYYVVHETRFRIGITLITIGMAFLLAWTVEFCLMLSRLEGGSRAVSAVTFASLISTPILLAFDLGVFAIAAESLLFPNMDSITALVVVVGEV